MCDWPCRTIVGVRGSGGMESVFVYYLVHVGFEMPLL